MSQIEIPEPVEVLHPHLDPLVRRIFIGFAFSALGSGLTMPFLYVYLSEVRGIATATVGLVFAFMGALGFVFSPVGGTLIDRFGPRPVMVIGLSIEAVGVALIGRVASVPEAFAVGGLVTVGSVALYPATTAMLTRLVPRPDRQRVYGFQFMLLNAGLGVGGVVSALIIDIDSLASFQRLYLFDALSYLAYIGVLASLPRRTGMLPAAGPVPSASGARQDEVDEGEAAVLPSWRAVLRDRALLRVVALSIVAITFGYAQFEAGFAAYAVDVAGVAPRTLGWAYAANTAAIVVGQLVTLRLIQGRRRTRLLALCAGIWALSWAIIASSDLTSGAMAAVLVVVGLGTFGIGETLWAPIAPAIVNDLAVEEMRGRYNALQGMTWTVATIIGPALAGMLIGNGLAHVWVVCTVGGTALAAVLFLRLRRHLTDAQDGVTD